MSSSNTMRPPEHVSIRIDGFVPSWAGPHPFDDGFAFGLEDGIVAFTDEKGTLTGNPHIMASSREAINGIAGIDNWLAATTRHDMTIWKLPQGSSEQAKVSTVPHGAHGVLGSSNHHFVAPLGHAGVMTINMRQSVGPDTPFRVGYFGDGSLNIYQMCEMPGNGTHSLFIAACRSQGVGLISFSSEKQEVEFERCTFNGIDVIDVVPVGTATYPHAAVAVGIGGEVVLFRNIVNHEGPILLKYDQFTGRAYRVLSCCGHLFVLTSKAVYVLGNLAERLTQLTLGEQGAPVMTIPMEAIDASICANRWLLAVIQDEVHRYDVHEIHDLITEFAANGTGAAPPLPQTRVNLGDWQPVNVNARRLQTATG